MTEHLLERSALDALAIVHKAGGLAIGFAKVEVAINRGNAVAVLHAREAAADGIRKLSGAARRRFEGEVLPVIEIFTTAQLDLALGRPSVVHAALLAGPAGDRFMARCRSLERFRSDDGGVGEAATRGQHEEG
jgi:ribosomal protein L7Ae-like RNA K-turn-binding protein